MPAPYGFEETLYRAALATLAAAQAVGQPLNFVSATSLFDSAFPKGKFVADLPVGAFPLIAMEPAADPEKFFTTGDPPAIQAVFAIDIILAVRAGSAAGTLLGDPAQTPPLVGLMEFARRVKNVLQTDMTLGGAEGLQTLAFPRTEYIYDYYPVRLCNLTMMLKGQLTTRSH